MHASNQTTPSVDTGNAESTIVLPCGHSFHTSCLTSYLRSSCVCPNCHASVPDHLLAASLDDESVETSDLGATQNSAIETPEEIWCRLNGVSLLALKAVRATADAVLSILLKCDLREGFYDQRNSHCPAACRPARDRNRPVHCSLLSVSDPAGDRAVLRTLHNIIAVVLSPIPVQSKSEMAHVRMCNSQDTPEVYAEAERLALPVRQLGTVPLCRFYDFAGGGCKASENCSFRHAMLPEEADPVPVCWWFMSAVGCKFGRSCKYAHPEDDFTWSNDGVSFQGSLWAERILTAGMLAGQHGYEHAMEKARTQGTSLRRLLIDKHVLLVGEGDFGFACSLLRTVQGQQHIDPGAVCATTIEGMTEVDEKVVSRINILQSKGMEVLHEVDAMRLASGGRATEALRQTQVVGWQFPYAIETVSMEEAASSPSSSHITNMMMLASFFRAVGAACWLKTELEVFVTVECCDAAHWRIARVARDAMFYLARTFPFDAKEFPGYHPTRTSPKESELELRRPIVLVFKPARPIRFSPLDPFDNDG
eukprot:SAG31_NODE_6812_length_1880_cov_1.514879_1_plen_536_part_00